MEERSNDAAVKVAQIKLKMEECAEGMGQRSNYAASKDARTKPCEEECAVDTGPSTTLLMNLLHLIYHIDQHMMTRLQLFPIIILPQLLTVKSVIEILLV